MTEKARFDRPPAARLGATCRRPAGPRVGRTAASLIGLGVALAPAPVLAQVFTDPLVPVPAIPLSPAIPGAPGAPADQFLTRGVSVVGRPRPEYDPLGVHFGDFFFFPRIELDEAYNDNIFATQTGKTSAFITTLAPSFDLRSSLPQNAVNLSAGGAFIRYASHSTLNSDNGYVDGNGKLDFDNTHYFDGDLRAERSHIDLGEPEVPGNAASPLFYTAYSALVGFHQYRLRIGYDATASVRREEYDAIQLIGGGFTPESQLNHFAYEFALRPYYEFSPGYQAYIRAAFNRRDYDHAQGNGVPILNSNGYRIDAGARVDLTGVTYVEGFIGYVAQDYQASTFGQIGGVDFGANAVWNVTQVTSLSLKAGRTVEDINTAVLGGVANSPGFLETSAVLGIDHELLRNLLLHGSLNYTNDAFENITRVDNIYGATAGVKYLLNRHFYLGANYTYQRVNSSGQSAMTPFSQNIFLVRLSTQL
jgi:hypothetical protein